jgi:hypothetical protein
MKKDLYLKVIIAALAILGIMTILSKKQEGFHNLTPGIFPESNTKGLLYPTYKMKNNPGLSNLDMEKAYKLYPSYAVGSYAQITNNKRYWDSPCNGLTTPPDMCGGLYQLRHCDHPPVVPPREHCNRVNYYCSR